MPLPAISVCVSTLMSWSCRLSRLPACTWMSLRRIGRVRLARAGSRSPRACRSAARAAAARTFRRQTSGTHREEHSVHVGSESAQNARPVARTSGRASRAAPSSRPTTGMKLVSPFQRGTTCTCRWSGTPAPAGLPRFMPMLNASGAVDRSSAADAALRHVHQARWPARVQARRNRRCAAYGATSRCPLLYGYRFSSTKTAGPAIDDQVRTIVCGGGRGAEEAARRGPRTGALPSTNARRQGVQSRSTAEGRGGSVATMIRAVASTRASRLARAGTCADRQVAHAGGHEANAVAERARAIVFRGWPVRGVRTGRSSRAAWERRASFYGEAMLHCSAAMQIGIAGLPGAGKTTLFNALAHQHASVGGYAGAEPNLAVVKVPDERLDGLSALFEPRKHTPAEVRFVDVAGVAKGMGQDSSAAVLAHLRTVDVLVHVIGAFQSGRERRAPISRTSPWSCSWPTCRRSRSGSTAWRRSCAWAARARPRSAPPGSASSASSADYGLSSRPVSPRGTSAWTSTSRRRSPASGSSR